MLNSYVTNYQRVVFIFLWDLCESVWKRWSGFMRVAASIWPHWGGQCSEGKSGSCGVRNFDLQPYMDITYQHLFHSMFELLISLELSWLVHFQAIRANIQCERKHANTFFMNHLHFKNHFAFQHRYFANLQERDFLVAATLAQSSQKHPLQLCGGAPWKKVSISVLVVQFFTQLHPILGTSNKQLTLWIDSFLGG